MYYRVTILFIYPRFFTYITQLTNKINELTRAALTAKAFNVPEFKCTNSYTCRKYFLAIEEFFSFPYPSFQVYEYNKKEW
jgi:hypothetical protein